MSISLADDFWMLVSTYADAATCGNLECVSKSLCLNLHEWKSVLHREVNKHMNLPFTKVLQPGLHLASILGYNHNTRITLDDCRRLAVKKYALQFSSRIREKIAETDIAHFLIHGLASLLHGDVHRFTSMMTSKPRALLRFDSIDNYLCANAPFLILQDTTDHREALEKEFHEFYQFFPPHGMFDLWYLHSRSGDANSDPVQPIGFSDLMQTLYKKRGELPQDKSCDMPIHKLIRGFISIML